jgi:thiamine monophosphate kinase
MDSSDGLISSLYELAEKNFVRLEIDTDSVPKDKHVSLEQALYGGEEYELVGCFREVPEGFKAIGVVAGGSIGVFPNNGGPRFSPSKGFQHF